MTESETRVTQQHARKVCKPSVSADNWGVESPHGSTTAPSLLRTLVLVCRPQREATPLPSRKPDTWSHNGARTSWGQTCGAQRTSSSQATPVPLNMDGRHLKKKIQVLKQGKENFNMTFFSPCPLASPLPSGGHYASALCINQTSPRKGIPAQP